MENHHYPSNSRSTDDEVQGHSSPAHYWKDIGKFFTPQAIGGFVFDMVGRYTVSSTTESPRFPEPSLPPRALTDGSHDADLFPNHLQFNGGEQSFQFMTEQYGQMSVENPMVENSTSPTTPHQLYPSPIELDLPRPPVLEPTPTPPSPTDYREVGSLNGRKAAEMRRASGTRKLYNCDLCTANFTRAKNLTYHKYSHFDYRPFACDECGRSFGTKHTMKRHRDKKHPPSRF